MKILSMTATFGKLEHETLTLKPGLNIIEAPNEWGKSTWCAFILAMLYGIDTRQQTTRSGLADKEHYAPWSGRPMSGRMDILWQGRQITLERSSKGRAPFGVFSAYETHTGLAVPELTAENCGLQLLGVEKNVFCRSGFIRLSDMPVTQDETLRRRLNALVTTGDESGEAEVLSAKLAKLKNTCRSNSKNGLLPQALSQCQALEEQLEQLRALQARKQRLCERRQALQLHLSKLDIHKRNLKYQSVCEHRRRLAEAQAQEEALRSRAEELERSCAGLPSREEAAHRLEQLSDLATRQQSLYMELQLQPDAPQSPTPPFGSETDPDRLEQALEQAAEEHRRLTADLTRRHFPLWIPGLVLLLTGIGAVLLWPLPGLVAAGVALLLTATGIFLHLSHRRRKQAASHQLRELAECYGADHPAAWRKAAAAYRTAHKGYEEALAAALADDRALRERSVSLDKELQQLCGGQQPERLTASLRQAVTLWDDLADTRRQLQQAQGYVRSLMAVGDPVEVPSQPDGLTHSPQDTDALIADTENQLRQLQQELGRCIGQMDALGSEEALNRKLAASRDRITQLNTALAAITLAQETLQSARRELQKRFAPQISRRAQELFTAMTQGRYDRLSLADDLTLRAGSAQEDTLRSALWRSDGTADQLYLALRLAVSEALTPDAPLVLDDALVRFDDQRLKTVLQILQKEEKQIILFTCQSREKNIIKEPV